MSRRTPWVKLPSQWILDGGLRAFRWKPGGKGADNLAALIAFVVAAHHANRNTGVGYLTYEDACAVTGLSRAKLSAGLQILSDLKLVDRNHDRRSVYSLCDYDGRWAKLPFAYLYLSNRVEMNVISVFCGLSLRRKAELNAIVLYLLFTAFRDNESNLTNLSYDKIEEYTSIKRGDIKTAISLLVSLSLVYIERRPSTSSDYGLANAYRIVGIDSYNHMGTRGRSDVLAEAL